MARLRYLALLCAEPATLASFYKAHFGLDELGRTPDGDVTLTDGGFNLTLFRNRPALHEPHMENASIILAWRSTMWMQSSRGIARAIRAAQ
jgi:hypothetical protein